MKLTKNLISKTVSETVGENAMPIIDFLKDKENISEFKIAEKTRTEIHTVRNILYKLNSHYLATYTRKKDKIKGWYISYWTLNLKRFKEVYMSHQKERVSALKEKLKKEQEYRDGLFICPALCSRMNFDSAMELNFKCPECGKLMHQQDNTKTIEHIKSMIEEMDITA